ncbi:type ISP restriction/modification enzyme [Streptomyces sp. NPDC005262]|uniref:type ISP restriction/modification enzyme n=1 Tax=Streptomyces sp. NPDC005262 TaxID=3364710 RepID=UPI0036BB65AD
MRYATRIGSAVPDTLSYDEETGTLRVGPGAFTGVPPEIWNYEVGGMLIAKKLVRLPEGLPHQPEDQPA